MNSKTKIMRRSKMRSFWNFEAKAWGDLFLHLDRLNTEDSKQAGTQFEIFCKHFFKTNPRIAADYKNLWLGSEVPAQIKKALNLSATDYGYDLVAETIDGRFAIIQCKFTSKQSEMTLSWTQSNLSSWLAISSRADIVILFTNASGIDAVTRRKASEKTFFEFNLSSLFELSTSDIDNILKSICGKKPKVEKYQPKPHQISAIEAVERGFKIYDCGKLILPCGAGKTITSLWIKENMAAKKTLVLVPSLALLRQFKNDWKSQERRSCPYICVCSELDIDLASDSIESHISEVGSPVTTDPSEIRKYLEIPGDLVVYSTYQSSPRIAAAIKGTNIKFDLVVCDEAHKTSGDRIESPFSVILDRDKIPARKKIFMTATPKIVSQIVKSRLGDDYLKYLADMNDENTYGPEFYRMTFGEGIKRGILVDYKIIAIGITDRELRRAIRDRKYAHDTTIDEIAHNYALDKVMNKYKCTHAVTFHSNVKKAEQFQRRHQTYFPQTDAFHVNGGQPTSERDSILREEFEPSGKAIITNARCLTEGVDVPAIDCVYFCDPKYSKVDIVQASGRALRLNRKKEKAFGYIVVPIFHSLGDNVETTIESGIFKNLISVVRAMADQDERIEDEIRLIAYGMGKERAGGVRRLKVHSSDKSKLIELIDFNNSLEKSIFTQVIQKSLIPWRPFEAAKAWVRLLKLNSNQNWRSFVAGGVKGKPIRPSDIPKAPDVSYRGKGWVSWSDFLGTQNLSVNREFQSFEQAKNFVRSLNLKSGSEWRNWISGKIGNKPARPTDIPTNPSQAYANLGWTNWPDWLGTTTFAGKRKYWNYSIASKYVQDLKLATTDEWRMYCNGKYKVKKPTDIPSHPHVIYKGRGWISIGEWLGTNSVAQRLRKFRNYSEARSFVRKLKLKNWDEWRSYCRGELLKTKLPLDIPANPHAVYKTKGWIGMADWLGVEALGHNHSFRSFAHARKFVREFEFKNVKAWQDWSKGELKGLSRRPADIPSDPPSVYKGAGWISWGDFLGNGNTKIFNWASYSEVRSYVLKLGLSGKTDWGKWIKGDLNGRPKRPSYIPSAPNRIYAEEWTGWGDFLGTGAVQNGSIKYLGYNQARAFVQKLKLKSEGEWRLYLSGKVNSLPKLPFNVPSNPNTKYRNTGWKTWGDWLGTGRSGHGNFRNFDLARKFVHSLKIRNSTDWSLYCQNRMPGYKPKPTDIPSNPNRAYPNEWKSYSDWLGKTKNKQL